MAATGGLALGEPTEPSPLVFSSIAEVRDSGRVVPPMTAIKGRLDDGAMNHLGRVLVIGSIAVDRFLSLARTSLPFQEQIQHCGHASQLLELARRYEVPLSRQDLVLLAMTGTQPYLPWSGRSKQFARAFALGSVQLDPDPSDHPCSAA